MASTTPRDPYEVLGVDRDADETQIKKAFRRRARELHPDVNPDDPDAETQFKQAAEAYEILSDPERRATYDRFGHEGLRSGGWTSQAEGFGSLNDLFEAFFGGAGGGFGGAFGGGRAGPRQGADIAAAIEVELAQAATGTSVEVGYELVAVCADCRGNGAEPGTPIVGCARCGGAGHLQAVGRTPFGQVVRTVVCDECAGDGRVAEKPCRGCRGQGRVATKATIAVEVPAGIADGQRIRLSGRGHAGEPGAPAGDLYVLVSVKDDPRFVRDGDDLVTVLGVPAFEAALGATLEVPTLEGPEAVEIPAGTQPGETISLHGRGMPILRRSGRSGDLRIVVDVVVPRRLSKDQRALVEQLAAAVGADDRGDEETVVGKLKRLFHQ